MFHEAVIAAWLRLGGLPLWVLGLQGFNCCDALSCGRARQQPLNARFGRLSRRCCLDPEDMQLVLACAPFALH
jgi:hypothetical protein